MAKKRCPVQLPKELHDELYIVRIQTDKPIAEIIEDATKEIRRQAKKALRI